MQVLGPFKTVGPSGWLVFRWLADRSTTKKDQTRDRILILVLTLSITNKIKTEQKSHIFKASVRTVREIYITGNS